MMNKVLYGIILISFISCKTNQTKFKKIKILGNQVEISIPDDWKNNDTLIHFADEDNKLINEAYYGKGFMYNRIFVSHEKSIASINNLSLVLKTELESYNWKQPDCVIYNRDSKIDIKENTITINTFGEFHNRQENQRRFLYNSTFIIVYPNEIFYFYINGTNSIKSKEKVDRIIKSIKIIKSSF
ncbi:MAG TPA: hypothetical protein PLS10_01740 [Chitinophagales bacterium]|nr:hypothetical protein [Chitinophagales bacterium]